MNAFEARSGVTALSLTALPRVGVSLAGVLVGVGVTEAVVVFVGVEAGDCCVIPLRFNRRFTVST